ncbi:hypothetical protein BC826DRAFT_172152 [Russula brevipes]|nr:hypothetical protein BC826DRAFT_172152 [Russula brevipes]
MVTCLSSLTRLEFFGLGFQLPIFRHGQPSLPPPTRAVLPALASLSFLGESEYMEDFVARIHTPRLGRLHARFFANLMPDVLQLNDFIGRTEALKLTPLNEAKMMFGGRSYLLVFNHPSGSSLEIGCSWTDWHGKVFAMARACRQLSSLVPHVERLELINRCPPLRCKG